MAALLENVRTAISSPRGGRPVCLICGRPVARHDDSTRLLGGAVVHRECAGVPASARARAARDA